MGSVAAGISWLLTPVSTTLTQRLFSAAFWGGLELACSDSVEAWPRAGVFPTVRGATCGACGGARCAAVPWRPGTPHSTSLPAALLAVLRAVFYRSFPTLRAAAALFACLKAAVGSGGLVLLGAVQMQIKTVRSPKSFQASG